MAPDPGLLRVAREGAKSQTQLRWVSRVRVGPELESVEFPAGWGRGGGGGGGGGGGAAWPVPGVVSIPRAEGAGAWGDSRLA